MRKFVFLLGLMLSASTSIFAEKDYTTDRHFSKVVRAYDVQSIELIEDVGKIAFDPIMKITLRDGRHFCMSHSFSRNPKRLSLYSLDDYDCLFTVGTVEFGIPLSYLQMYFDFDIGGIGDIIIHYEEIHSFIELLNSYVLYFTTDDRQGVYVRDVCPKSEQPGFLNTGKEQILFEVWDKNESRITFQN